jgi:hypothetical protein
MLHNVGCPSSLSSRRDKDSIKARTQEYQVMTVMKARINILVKKPAAQQLHGEGKAGKPRSMDLACSWPWRWDRARVSCSEAIPRAWSGSQSKRQDEEISAGGGGASGRSDAR